MAMRLAVPFCCVFTRARARCKVSHPAHPKDCVQ